MTFQDCHLIEPILKALTEQGYTAPTAIQAGAIAPALSGRDILGTARTGTGKTCAFATPILQRLFQDKAEGRPIRALVLTPTRELAIQNQECFEAYGKYLPLKSTVIFGGVGQGPQVEALERGVDILVATPGRLADLYQQGLIDLSHLEIFVLDEADRMLDMGFIHDVRKILKWLPKKKQTLFFSATMPDELCELVESLLHDPVHISVDPVNSTVDAIRQTVYRVDKGNKTNLLVHLLERNGWPSVLVFTRTKHGANKVSRDLEKKGIPSAAIHGNKSQTARQAALSGFKSGELRVLVATDLAARGLDIEDLSCVVNYNLPEVPETYVHRIGRTGRAGRNGIAISFCSFDEQELLRDIEKLTRKAVPVVTEHPYPMQQTEPAQRDKHGRIINAEDQEAREAARALAKQRSARQKQEAQPAAPAPESKAGKKKAKASAKAEPAPVTPAAPAQESKPEQPKKKKGKKAQQAASVSELFGVDIPDLLPKREEEPPAIEEKFDSSDILHRKPKKPERRVVPSLSSVSLLPSIELKETFGSKLREDSLSFHPDDALDATDRMFRTKATVPERYAEKKKASPAGPPKAKSEKKAAKAAEESAPAKKKGGKKAAKDAAKQSAPKAKEEKGSEKQAQSRKPKKAGKAAAKKETSALEPQAKKSVKARFSAKALPASVEKRVQKRTRAPLRAESGMRYSRTKDSTEQESLMKPYYLSDMDHSNH